MGFLKGIGLLRFAPADIPLVKKLKDGERVVNICQTPSPHS